MTTMSGENTQPQDLTDEQADAVWDEVTADSGDSPSQADALADSSTTDDGNPAADNAAAAPAPAPAAPAPQPQGQEQGQGANADPYAGLPDNLRTFLQQRDLQQEQRLRSAEGRVAALQRDLAQRPPAPAPTPAAPPPPSALDALRDELPEVARAIEESRSQSVDPAAVRAQVAADMQEELLEGLHPGWQQTVVGNEFQLWLQAQPADYKERIASTQRASDMAGALRRFGEHQTQAAARTTALQARQKRTAAAAVPNTRAGRPAPAKSEDQMSDDEYWNHISR